MCDDCENGYPSGGAPRKDACEAQLAECLRDAIRSLAYAKNLTLAAAAYRLDTLGPDIDLCINELVERARLQRGKVA